MKFPEGAAKRTDPAAAAEVLYDAVIVGGGIAGAIIASRLSDAGKRVLILETGPAEDLTLRGYESYLDRRCDGSDRAELRGCRRV